MPLDKYHIPLIIYSPKHIRPQVLTRMASQIDVAPTLMGLLNQSYVSRFFGKDVLLSDISPERALMGTYQKVGLFESGKMVILSPQRKVDIQQYPADDNKPATNSQPVSVPESTATDQVADAVAYYQGASYQLHKRLMIHKAGENH